MRILIVEDDAKIASFMQKGLEEEGFQVDVSEDGEDCESEALQKKYDLILLDLALPRKSGFDLCEQWRRDGVTLPIIVVTAKGASRDVVRALEGGADDYITKPFSFEELVARIRANLRRISTYAEQLVYRVDDLYVDIAKRNVMRGNEPVYLSSREFTLLAYLLQHQDRIISKEEIMEKVFGFSAFANTNIVEVYINHLRKKLDCGTQKQLIHTIRGKGYILKVFDD